VAGRGPHPAHRHVLHRRHPLREVDGLCAVYHLRGGILAYLAEIEAAGSLWRGECFLFDERVSITHGERPGAARLCETCGQPVLPAERHSCASEGGEHPL